MARYQRRYRLWSGGKAATAVLALGLLGAALPATAAMAATGPVSAVPQTQTPHLLATGAFAQVRQLVQCGGTMYAVGSFTQMKRDSTTYTRDNVISFSATSPFKVTTWAPAVNGVVNSIAFNGTNCADAYLGGKFSKIGATTVKNLAKVSTSTGQVVTAFGHSASGQVETLLSYKSHIIAGGYYTSINGSTADPYMTSLNPTTGKDDGLVKLKISGNYSYQGVASNATRVYNQALHGGLDLVMGDFTSAGGLARQQIFMLNLTGKTAAVTGWTSPLFDGECYVGEPFYVQSAAWSPDGSTIYIGDTGYHPNGVPVGVTPRTGLCDAAAAFPATQAAVTPKWINYTGCDSLYSAAADASTAYFGGHERWSQNPNDCDQLGAGAVPAPGMEGLSPSDGSLLLNGKGAAGLYSRSRGYGADDMLVTSKGLWIASDNLQGEVNGKPYTSTMCGGVSNLAGICFLPY